MNYIMENMETFIRALGYFLSFGAPVCVFCFFFFLGVALRDLLRSPAFYVLAFTGPGVVILWYVYNAILESLGIDSVLGLIVNLFLFSMLGIAISFVLKFFPYEGPRLKPHVVAYFDKFDLNNGGRSVDSERSEEDIPEKQSDAEDTSDKTPLLEG